MGEWLPPNGVGGGRRSSKQGACAGSDVTRQLLWRRPEKDFAAAAATCFDASSAAACATSVCKDYCAAEPSCGAIETVQRMDSSGGSEYDCHSIDVYSNMPGPAASVTHVVPRPDRPTCLLKPAYAAAQSRCPVPTADCACCLLVAPLVDLHTGGLQCEDLAFGDLRGLDVWKANFESVEMTCATFDNARLAETNFKDAVAARASFVRAELDRSSFEATVLPHANFSGASLREAKLEYSSLRHTTFDGADLSSASFVESDLSHASFFGATGVSTARFDRVLGMNTVKGLDRKTLAAALLLQG